MKRPAPSSGREPIASKARSAPKASRNASSGSSSLAAWEATLGAGRVVQDFDGLDGGDGDEEGFDEAEFFKVGDDEDDDDDEEDEEIDGSGEAAARAAAGKKTSVPAPKDGKKAASKAPVATKPISIKSSALVAAPAAADKSSAPSVAVLSKKNLFEESDEEEEIDSAPAAARRSAAPGKRAVAAQEESDGEESGGSDGDDSEDEEDDDDDDMDGDDLDDDGYRGGDLEKAAERLASRRARVAAEADAEMRLQVATAEGFSLPSAADLAAERRGPPNLASLRRRVADVVHVLTDFRSRRDPSRPRDEYVECLSQDLSELFGYNRELVDIFVGLFSPAEALAFFEANETPPPVTIRINTLRARKRELCAALVARGVSLEPVGAWTKAGIKILESPVPIGATPEYLAGHYMLQSAASMVPVIALAPQPGERVLDVAAAPGGKTTHLAQLMGNTGVLVANDPKPERLPSLVANLARMGVSNSLVCSVDGRKIPQVLGRSSFDRILLDAPCTGLGVIARDPAARTSKGREDVVKMALLQKQLLLAAIDALDAGSKTGGVMVYSTCSISVEENEAVVAYALRNRNIKVEAFVLDDGSDDVGRPGYTSWSGGSFPPELRLTRRFFPHVHNMDGFFVAKLRKLSNDIPKGRPALEGAEEGESVPQKAQKRKRARADDDGDDDMQGDSGVEETAAEVDAFKSKSARSSVAPGGAAARRLHDERASAAKALKDAERVQSQKAHDKRARDGAKHAKAARSAEPSRPAETHSEKPALHGALAAAPVSTAAPSAAAADPEPKERKKLRLPSEITSDQERRMQHSAILALGRTPASAAPDNSSHAGAVVDFVKKGEKLHQKKRKAGRRVREAKEERLGGADAKAAGGSSAHPGGEHGALHAKPRKAPKNPAQRKASRKAMGKERTSKV